jgi:GNAT acetyltransferase-like protein
MPPLIDQQEGQPTRSVLSKERTVLPFASPGPRAEASPEAFRIVEYHSSLADRWDALVARSHNGTLLHTRQFLDYHRSRFEDESVLVENAKGTIVGVLPAARNPASPRQVISHPGITYGGLVHGNALKGERLVRVMGLIFNHFRQRGFHELVYKATPHIYHRVPAQDDHLALVRLGASLHRVDLASVIDVSHRPPLRKGRVHALKKATKHGIRLESDTSHLPALWTCVLDNLRTRHSTAPTHSLGEMTDLFQRLPDRISCAVGILDGRVVGGVILFDTDTALVIQYMASTQAGRRHAVLDLVIDKCVKKARDCGKRYLSFGTSMAGKGRLNQGLHHFKSLFGAGGVSHAFFLVDLLEKIPL